MPSKPKAQAWRKIAARRSAARGVFFGPATIPSASRRPGARRPALCNKALPEPRPVRPRRGGAFRACSPQSTGRSGSDPARTATPVGELHSDFPSTAQKTTHVIAVARDRAIGANSEGAPGSTRLLPVQGRHWPAVPEEPERPAVPAGSAPTHSDKFVRSQPGNLRQYTAGGRFADQPDLRRAAHGHLLGSTRVAQRCGPGRSCGRALPGSVTRLRLCRAIHRLYAKRNARGHRSSLPSLAYAGLLRL
jgi:hypothetical protein